VSAIDIKIEQAHLLLATAVMHEAINHVAATGTRRDAIRVTFGAELDGSWGWLVEAYVLTFSTPTGRRKFGTGTLKVSGWSTISPLDAACGCAQDIQVALNGGREICGGGRIEIAKEPTR
jgi:hypothetical protein